MSMFIGEALVGEGNEIAHIDLLIGSKDGPVGHGVCQRPGQPEAGSLQPAGRADAQPDLQAGHGAHHQGHDQGGRAGRADVRPGPGGRRQGRGRQRGRGRHSQGQAEDLVIVCGVFIHWDAKDDAKIYQYNYEATKLAIQRAMKASPRSTRSSPRRTRSSIRSGRSDLGDRLPAIGNRLSTNRRRHAVSLGASGTAAVRNPKNLTFWDDLVQFRKPVADSRMKNVLIQLDSDPQPSVFDRIVALDAGRTKCSATAPCGPSRSRVWSTGPSSRADPRT